jgi:hypothetical protein
MMVKEVLKGYSKNSCKGNGKANVLWHIHVGG